MYQTRNGWSVVSGAVLAPLLVLFALRPAWGQTETARLQGTVVDVTGASVGGATVTVTNLGTNRVVTAQTDATDGSYSIPALPVGRYRIEVEKQNFKPVTREVTLQISQVAAVNFTLALGAVSEAVTVTAEAALVDSASSAMGDVVQSRPVTELPLNGRNFTQLATLIPGVTRGVPDGQATGAQGNAETFRYGNSGGAALSVNGLRPQANNFVLDGVDNNESLVNTVIFFPPAEAIEEFRVQTSVAPAEFGRAGGAIVNTAIKSGTNEYHGSAFEFFRNSQLDARPTFAPQRNPFRRNQFGGTLGGPLVRNKLFVFGDYQGLRQFQPKSTDFATVPTAEFRNGNFSQLLNPSLSGLSQPIAIRDLTTGQPFLGNIIPQARLNPAGQKYLNAFPLPNTNGGKVTQNYVTQRNETQSFNDFDIRTDWNIRESDQLFGRFSYGEADQSVSSRLPALPAGFGSGTNFSRTRGIVLGETHTFSPNLINEFRLGFARIFFAYTPPFQDQTISADLGIPNANYELSSWRRGPDRRL
ncbi:MAG: carboxypeptidase-like regulatory domain-containing protein [Bryobacterales bacterium]|nr:carboxypeptidase-like regulatory domain-containing protein [Bryobacterales bacterium]